jgi:AI-2 transport protein TqsA
VPAAVTVILMVSAFFTGMALLGVTLQQRVLLFFGKLQGTAARLPGVPESTRLDWSDFVTNVATEMQNREFPNWVTEVVNQSLANVDTNAFTTGLLGGGFDFIKGLLLVVIYMLFIFAEQAVFRRKILAIFDDRRDETRQLLDTIGRGIQRYLGVKTVTSLATGSLCYAVLVALEVPQPLLLGVLTFALNYIPTFGSFIAGFIATLVALVMPDHDLTTPLIVLTTYVGVNLLLGSYLEPKILGRELNLSPLVVIISVVVWAGLWGAVGTFLAVPLTAALQIILASNENTRPIAIMLSSGPPRDERRRRDKSKPAAA